MPLTPRDMRRDATRHWYVYRCPHAHTALVAQGTQAAAKPEPAGRRDGARLLTASAGKRVQLQVSGDARARSDGLFEELERVTLACVTSACRSNNIEQFLSIARAPGAPSLSCAALLRCGGGLGDVGARGA